MLPMLNTSGCAEKPPKWICCVGGVTELQFFSNKYYSEQSISHESIFCILYE